MHRLALLLGALLTLSVAAAADLVRLDGIEASETDGAFVLRVGDRELVYVDGFGWLADVDAGPPEWRGDGLYGAPALLEALGVEPGSPPVTAAPVATGAGIDGVRFAGETSIRVVLDVGGAEAWQLTGIDTRGRVEPGDRLHLTLPPMAIRTDPGASYRGLETRLVNDGDGTHFEVGGAAFEYEVFVLAGPTRIVLDLSVERPPIWVDALEPLRDGVTYQRVRAVGAGGPTWVHVVEVDAGVGEWRVVGAQGEARTTDRWADGAFAAINGGYFDTGTRRAIGMLLIDRELLSHPSRGRAVIAFGDGPPVIDRVRANYSIWLDGRAVAVRGAEFVDEIAVLYGPGTVGSGRYGALVVDVESGEVVANRIGPVRVSAQQYAVVYPAELRPLALAEPGSVVRYAWHVDPPAIGAARYAVEAGPLLLKDGVDVLRPEIEQFAVGQRILDGLTQQAAIGVRADGSVVMIAAEAMVASDLVPLFQELGVRDALRLDSGGSTTLYAGGRVLNRRSEREVANAIVLRMP